MRYLATTLALALATLAAGCGEKEADAETRAAEGCRGRYDAIQRWITANNRVPTSDEELRVASGSKGKDPWGHDYVIDIVDGSVVVFSWGPDGIESTDDDIYYPPGE